MGIGELVTPPGLGPGDRKFESCYPYHFKEIVQLVERWIPNPLVIGSSPILLAIIILLLRSSNGLGHSPFQGVIRVRFPYEVPIRKSSSGRTSAFGAENLGSNPSFRSILILRRVVRVVYGTCLESKRSVKAS